MTDLGGQRDAPVDAQPDRSGKPLRQSRRPDQVRDHAGARADAELHARGALGPELLDRLVEVPQVLREVPARAGDAEHQVRVGQQRGLALLLGDRQQFAAHDVAARYVGPQDVQSGQRPSTGKRWWSWSTAADRSMASLMGRSTSAVQPRTAVIDRARLVSTAIWSRMRSAVSGWRARTPSRSLPSSTDGVASTSARSPGPKHPCHPRARCVQCSAWVRRTAAARAGRASRCSAA